MAETSDNQNRVIWQKLSVTLELLQRIAAQFMLRADSRPRDLTRGWSDIAASAITRMLHNPHEELKVGKWCVLAELSEVCVWPSPNFTRLPALYNLNQWIFGSLSAIDKKNTSIGSNSKFQMVKKSDILYPRHRMVTDYRSYFCSLTSKLSENLQVHAYLSVAGGLLIST